LDKIVVFEDKFLHVLESSHRKTVLEPLNRGEINEEIASLIESIAEQIAG